MDERPVVGRILPLLVLDSHRWEPLRPLQGEPFWADTSRYLRTCHGWRRTFATTRGNRTTDARSLPAQLHTRIAPLRRILHISSSSFQGSKKGGAPTCCRSRFLTLKRYQLRQKILTHKCVPTSIDIRQHTCAYTRIYKHIISKYSSVGLNTPFLFGQFTQANLGNTL